MLPGLALSCIGIAGAGGINRAPWASWWRGSSYRMLRQKSVCPTMSVQWRPGAVCARYWVRTWLDLRAPVLLVCHRCRWSEACRETASAELLLTVVPGTTIMVHQRLRTIGRLDNTGSVCSGPCGSVTHPRPRVFFCCVAALVPGQRGTTRVYLPPPGVSPQLRSPGPAFQLNSCLSGARVMAR